MRSEPSHYSLIVLPGADNSTEVLELIREVVPSAVELVEAALEGDAETREAAAYLAHDLGGTLALAAADVAEGSEVELHREDHMWRGDPRGLIRLLEVPANGKELELARRAIGRRLEALLAEAAA